MAAGNIDKWLTDDALLLIQGWARDGLTCADIAHNMGVCRTTLGQWKEKNEQIRAALSQGKEVADRRVENALYKRAIGYDVEEIKTIDDPKNGVRI